MKMICPHCGVRGSADNSLLGRKVKCPKCSGLFEAGAEVVEAIAIEEPDLEQLPLETESLAGDVASEEEVEDVFSKLLAGDSEPGRSEEQGDIDRILADQRDGDGIITELTGSAVVADGDGGWPTAEEDETLTVIEDFPEELVADAEMDADSTAREEVAATEQAEGIIEEDQDQADLLAAAEEESGAVIEAFEDEGVNDETGRETDSQRSEKDTEADPDISILDAAGEEEEAEREIAGDEFALEAEEMDEKEVLLDASFLDGQLDEQPDEEADGEDEAEEQEATVQKCAACGSYVDPDNKYKDNGNVYCSACVPAGIKAAKEEAEAKEDLENTEENTETAGAVSNPGRFTVTTLIKDAWRYSKGVKGAIWGGFVVMYLLLFGLGGALAFGSAKLLPGLDRITTLVLESGVLVLVSIVSFVFSAGIIMIAVHGVGRKSFSWKMVFSGFKRFGSLLILCVLQMIMLVIGFCLFVLPGIYLSVGYILAVPLLFVKGLSPWQALETSRLAIHKRWWTVFFALLVMSFLLSVSAIPLGLGLIWTVPMFVVMLAVLYYHFFGVEEEGEEPEEEPEEELEEELEEEPEVEEAVEAEEVVSVG